MNESSRQDPITQLIEACKTALAWTVDRGVQAEDRRMKAEAEITQRTDETKRIEAALAVLAAPAAPATKKRGGKTHVWTDEQRQAARERMKRMQEDGKLRRPLAQPQPPPRMGGNHATESALAAKD